MSLRRHASIWLAVALVLTLALDRSAAQQAGAPATAPAAGAQSGQLTRRHENGYVKVGSRFYLLGGRRIQPVDIFDPATGAWTKGAPPPIELHHFQALEYERRLWVVGAMTGRYPTEPPVDVIYLYDPATDAWTKGPEIPADRRRGGAGVVLYEGEIFVIAGITNGHTDGHVKWFDAFNPKTGQWRRLPDAPRARDHFHAAVIDGKLYAAGGRTSSFATGQVFELTVPEVDVYDFKTGRWTTLPPTANIPTPRAGSTVAVVNGRLLVIGGESAQPLAHADVEAYDPASGTWAKLPPLSMGRHATQAVLHEGRIYLASGSRTRGGTEVDSQEIYTPKF
jgi:N-acetylneuraminic acid mutarotase